MVVCHGDGHGTTDSDVSCGQLVFDVDLLVKLPGFVVMA